MGEWWYNYYMSIDDRPNEDQSRAAKIRRVNQLVKQGNYLKENVEDNPLNVTRFFVISNIDFL